MSELRPVYCKFCRQTLLSDNLEKCSGCGKVGGVMDPADEAAVLTGLVAQKQAEPEPAGQALERAVGGTVRFYRLLRLTAAGVFCIGLGLALILIPDLRDNPRTISGNDIGRGACAILVGFVLVSFLFLSTRRDQ